MGTSNAIPKGGNTKTTLLSLELRGVKIQWPLPKESTVKYITKQIREGGKERMIMKT